MANHGTLPSIKQLKGRENYETWKFAVRAYFLLEDIWVCIETPEGLTGDASTAMATKIAQGEQKAYSKLVLLIDPENFVHIQAATTAKEIWSALQVAFEDNGLTRRVGLLRALTTTKLNDCASADEYVTTMISTAHKLRNIGMNISDEWLGTMMLAGLPCEYEPMIMGIESSGLRITADVIKAKIIQDVRNVGANGEVALFGRRSNKGYSSRGKGNGKCFECDKLGHIARNCPDKKNKKTQQCKSVEALLCSSFLATENRTENWFVDSGASSHMTSNRALLSNETISSCSEVVAANSSRMKIECEGDINMRLLQSGRSAEVIVKGVQYVPDLCTNLLSVSAMTKQGKSVLFNENGCRVLNREGKIVATASLVGNMYRLDCDLGSAFVGKLQRVKQDLWHRRLGHIGHENFKKMCNGIVDGVDCAVQNYEPCAICLKGRQSRFPFSSNGTRAQEMLELVHSDVCGPMKHTSNGGARYFLIFIDDFSRKVFVFFLKAKSDVYQKFIDFVVFAENQTGRKIKTLRSDNGGEYCNGRMRDFLKSKGIQHQTSAPYTPQQNGMSERMNRSLVEKARCMLFEANLEQSFWAEAIATAAFIINRSPCSGLNETTPEEIWSGKKPNLDFMRVFGCKAMVHVPKGKRRKFDPKSTECYMIGYSESSKAYRLHNFSDGKVIVSRDVVFLENEYREVIGEKCIEFNPFFECSVETATGDNGAEAVNVHVDEFADGNSLAEGNANDSYDTFNGDEAMNSTAATLNRSNDESDNQNDSIIEVSSTEDVAANSDSSVGGNRTEDESFESFTNNDDSTSDYEPSQAIRRAERLANKPRPNYAEMVFAYNATSLQEPISVNDALSRPDAKHWETAMKEEIDSLRENNTWELVHLPADRKPINSKWVFKLKRDASGKVVRHKARLVIKGCAQKHGIDYDETYSPVVRYTSIRFLFALAAKHDLDIDQMDAVSAFLQGEIGEIIYMRQPEGFSNGTEMVCRLKKSLYGLKQASRVWNMKLNAALIAFGLTRSEVDPCIYFRVTKEYMLFVAVYVDDLLLFTNDTQIKRQLKEELCKQFKMKDMGEASSVLGIRVQRNRRLGTISIDQSHYVKEIVRRFDMHDCNAVSTPMDHNQRLSAEMSPQNQLEREEMVDVPYQEAIGSIMFAAQVTRPDVCFAVNTVSRFIQNPGKAHWIAVKRILRYLNGTANARLVYSKTGNVELTGYCDADWASDIDSRRSVTGYVFLYQGAAISWNSRKQPTVAGSTTEAEYMSLSAASSEAIWLKQLRAELECANTTIQINCDNKGAIDLSSTTAYHKRSKHIDVKHHVIRERIANHHIRVHYVKTDEMIADVFTKAIIPAKHIAFTNSFGIDY